MNVNSNNQVLISWLPIISRVRGPLVGLYYALRRYLYASMMIITQQTNHFLTMMMKKDTLTVRVLNLGNVMS